MPDPQSERTFAASVLDAGSDAVGVDHARFTTALLALRRTLLRTGATVAHVADEHVVVGIRQAAGLTFLLAFHFADATATTTLSLPGGGAWTFALDTRAHTSACAPRLAGDAVRLPLGPWQGVCYRRAS
ncbi:MAG: hypothetical protein IPM29_28930 [Planctomycetes bacterium]|nr:hypothetical protein [Planctomycetota bacterium]